ncbi:scarecrow-like protein 30 isoform X2 [Argentina anserina]|uniref:scarecrow-like protein 30 isoform X2 n=1 Tax=Argentina anserina TaxID=57926 RepID=UPI0021763FFE|nr:scarecrow-like protein 30 isoform X2 [Potentilla anserina]
MESFLFDRASISSNSYSDDGNHELINPLFIQTNLDLPSDRCTSLNPTSGEYAGDSYDYNTPVLSSGGGIYGKTYPVADVQYSHVECQPDTSLVSDSLSKLQSLENSERVEEDNNGHDKFKILQAERFQPMPQGPQTHIGSTSVYEQQSDGHNSENGSEAKKDRQRRDNHCLEEWRSNKQSAVAYSADDSELQEMFDKAMFFQTVNYQSVERSRHSKGSKLVYPKIQSKEEKVVDLCTMLIQCAQAVASYDQQNAREILNQIRHHSSPYGDATQRLAHYFADALQVRLTGTRVPSFSYTIGPLMSTGEILKYIQTFFNAMPFRTHTEFFANMTIMKLAEKATSVHIIDFGIAFGFQWPSLIQWLSERHGGPPKLRITAIEPPQPGFRPTERVEESGRRLAKYSARFGVPFEFDVIAKKWETIEFDDLKIDRNKVIVVNCLHRLRHVPELTIMGNSPRDDVLKLIRKINPEIFIHGVVNGAHNSSFFLTRFKQAISYFSAYFDITETTLPCEDQQRLFYERAAIAREIMNVVACEGFEIVERPETYRKWQSRNVRAGFKQLPLDHVLLEKVRTVSKSIGYHDGFSIDEDDNWMVQGWRGKVLLALSFWKAEV